MENYKNWHVPFKASSKVDILLFVSWVIVFVLVSSLLVHYYGAYAVFGH